MKTIAPADLQRWSEDVARDPSSLSFVSLARAYRKQGRRDAALKLCLRGLEHHPNHVEAHALLALIYFELGQRTNAYDEWSMVLRLDPENFEALRGMGFFHLEHGQLPSALRSLNRASALRPTDVTVQEALKLIHERTAPPAPTTHMLDRDPWADAEASPRSTPAPGPTDVAPAAAVTAPPVARVSEPALRAVAPAPLPPAQPKAPPPPAPAVELASAVADLPDPTRLFEPLLKSGQILGALLLDSQGLVLAGTLTSENGSQAEVLGATLSGAVEEARRTTTHLALGSWRGILLEAERALLHLTPVGEGLIVLLVARRETPTGWMLRNAQQAAALAARFLEAHV